MIKEEIKKLEEEIQNKIQEIETLKKLSEFYPDLSISYRRNSKQKYFCSRVVNNQVTHYEYHNSCGCCSDAEFQIYPYIETKYGKVYSEPFRFGVGENSDFPTPYKEWEEFLRSNLIPEHIIDSVRLYFEKCAQDKINDLEEQLGDLKKNL